MGELYRLISVAGLAAMLGIGWLCSTNRWKVSWWQVAKGVTLQLVFALLILKTGPGRQVFEWAGTAMEFVISANNEGTKLVFGPFADESEFGFVFFITVSGTIILVSALMSGLYYLGIMQWVVWVMAKAMQVILGTSGAESLAAAANVFAGQTEAPLVIKPYLRGMTESELMALMTGGMTTIAGGVMAAYVGMLNDVFPDIAGHLLAASVMSAPASLVLAKIMVPETESPKTAGEVRMSVEKEGDNILDAICHGASDGLKLALNVMAMLIAFTALVALFNGVLGAIGGYADERISALGFQPSWELEKLSLQRILGWVGAPLAVVMGVPLEDARAVGTLLGERTVLNEFFAYTELAKEAPELSDRSKVIVTYALCGFANFASIAIQIGGIGALVPERRKQLAKLGFRAMVGGTLASFMTASIAGALV